MHKKKQRFFYCPKCGGVLQYKSHNDILRLTCLACSYILYENPLVGVAGVVLDNENRILLGCRNSSRYHGLWCIPCGYLEYDEDLYAGLRREFKEETNLDIEAIDLLSVQSNFHDPERHSVGIWFRVRITGGTMMAGDDLSELYYFPLDQIPLLAFVTDEKVVSLLKNETIGEGQL